MKQAADRLALGLLALMVALFGGLAGEVAGALTRTTSVAGTGADAGGTGRARLALAEHRQDLTGDTRRHRPDPDPAGAGGTGPAQAGLPATIPSDPRPATTGAGRHPTAAAPSGRPAHCGQRQPTGPPASSTPV